MRDCIPPIRYSNYTCSSTCSSSNSNVVGGIIHHPQQQGKGKDKGGFLILSPSPFLLYLYNNKHTTITTSTSITHLSKQHQPNTSSNYDFLGFHDDDDDDDAELELKSQQKDEHLNIKMKMKDDEEVGFLKFNKELEEELSSNSSCRSRMRRREMMLMKRSNMIAKQVISINSASSLGFVSQLWLHPSSWQVMLVEIRPNLLSADLQMFLLDDVAQVGDVVLIQDETVMENHIKMLGLETLVGYTVVTPGRQTIGKVRGYTFNINSGAVESLELDSFGISAIPSSLLSTYALFVEDVLEVTSDVVGVHEAAASRIQRLTKGFWDPRKAVKSICDEPEEYSDKDIPPVQSGYGRHRQQGSSIIRNPQAETEEMAAGEWELPMDYL